MKNLLRIQNERGGLKDPNEGKRWQQGGLDGGYRHEGTAVDIQLFTNSESHDQCYYHYTSTPDTSNHCPVISLICLRNDRRIYFEAVVLNDERIELFKIFVKL